jgi:LAGLIDADG endonuclease
VEKPDFIPSTLPLDPDWIAGFINGDGCFSLGYQKRLDLRLGATYKPYFQVTQHACDKILLERIAESFGGSLVKSRNCLDLRVTGLSTLTSKIVPFFSQYPLPGAKALDFRDFSLGI